MTINLGRVEAIHVHLATGEINPTAPKFRWLCTDAGEKMQTRTLSTWTNDRSKVTCPRCLEWMHA